MCELAELLSRVQSVDRALFKMEKNRDMTCPMDRFKKLVRRSALRNCFGRGRK